MAQYALDPSSTWEINSKAYRWAALRKGCAPWGLLVLADGRVLGQLRLIPGVVNADHLDEDIGTIGY